MIKKLVLVVVAVIAIHGYGQQGTTSPYSFYGIGSLKFKGTVENRSMGGLSIYNDSIHVNLRNPASYAGENLETWGGKSRPVKFSVGGSYSSTNLLSNTSKANSSSSTFDYLAINIPVGKFGFGFGLMPYTSVGYKLEALNDAGDLGSRFEGEGGVNKAFLGFGYQLVKGLNVGVDVQYNFGNIQNSIIAFQYADGFLTQFRGRERNRSDLSGLNLNLGLSYKTPLGEKLELVSSIIYRPEHVIKSKNERSISTISINGSNQEFEIDSIDADLAASGLAETDLMLPSKLTFGAGIGAPLKWFIGAETTFLKSSGFSNALVDNGTTYEDAYSFSLGGFFIPQYNSFSKYWKRMVYRAGIRTEETGLNINNESIKEFGISFGVGIPVGESRLLSNANFGLEIGKRGTKNSNLIQENFMNFQLSLSLNDRWFIKRKYD